ncbi:MAG: hypothetical protein RR194_01335, partial [Ruthenibacterium sp.]
AALCYAMLLFIAFFAPVGGGSCIYFKFYGGVRLPQRECTKSRPCCVSCKAPAKSVPGGDLS